MADGTGSPVQALSRGEVAARTGCNIETILYYERIGLLPAPPRSEGGHRRYGEDLLKRVIFIRRSRELGFTLKEIRSLLGLVDAGDYSCAEVKSMTLDHLGDVRAKIADLRTIEKVLKDVVSQCDDDVVPECPVIDALFRKNEPV